MASVTSRIKQIKQPRGGYINPKEFEVINLNDNVILHEDENIHSSLIGLAVDYLTRCCSGTSVEEAFRISFMGANIIKDLEYSYKLYKGIKGLDDKSIKNACQLVGYDVCFRAGAMFYKPVKDIKPDNNTIENIRTMVMRSMNFFEEYGPKTKDGFTFEEAYTDLITTGDGDFLTKSTLWDFKVSNKGLTSAHTLQLLIYYLMGKKSIHKEFDTIEKIGVFNPRLNNVYLLDISKIDKNIIEEVNHEVIGYK